MMRRSDSGAEKMMGTSIDSPNLDPLAPGATAILQQNWRGGREVENRRGEIGKHGRLISTQKLRSTFTFPIKTKKNDFKKLSAAPTFTSDLLFILSQTELRGRRYVW